MEDLTKATGEQKNNPENNSISNIENEEKIMDETNFSKNQELEIKEELINEPDSKLEKQNNVVISEEARSFENQAEPEEKILEEAENTTKENKLPELAQDKSITTENESISSERNMNLEEETEEITENYLSYTRDQLVSAVEDFLKEDISAVKNKISLIKVAFYTHTNEMKKAIYDNFIAEGGIKEDFQQSVDELEERFKKAIEIYRGKRQKYLEKVECEKQENLAKKLQILEELKELINSEETLKKTYDEFKVLQDRWREIGVVPRSEINNLWKNYHFLIEKFFDKVKINKELKMLDLKKNLDQKIEICEKVEELLLEPSVLKAFKSLQGYREKWREIGPVPSDKNDEIWERFKTATEQIDLRRKEYYDLLAEEQQKNLLAKTALCEKAEEILSKEIKTVSEWNKYTTELEDLMKLWKTIGPASKTTNNEIWERFKTTLDAFYNNKKEFFDKLKEEQSENYDRKMNICLQAEEISKRTDWKKATDELLNLQKEWKEIGSVSRKVSDKLWARFREACDIFFAKKTEFFSEIRTSEAENLAKKEDILKRLKEYTFTEDRNENLRVMKDFQREWMEVGFVPIAEKERLQREFRSLVNQLFEQLKISSQELQKESFRNRLNNINPKGAVRFLSKERHDIQDKIQKLKDNLKLWENNLGFLAQSRQADILRKEFDKKMQSARQEIALLEAKLRILLESKTTDKNEKEDTPKTTSVIEVEIQKGSELEEKNTEEEIPEKLVEEETSPDTQTEKENPSAISENKEDDTQDQNTEENSREIPIA